MTRRKETWKNSDPRVFELLEIISQKMFDNKFDYIHQNPVGRLCK